MLSETDVSRTGIDEAGSRVRVNGQAGDRWLMIVVRASVILERAYPRKFRETPITFRFLSWEEIEEETGGRRGSAAVHGWADRGGMRVYLDRDYFEDMSDDFVVYVVLHEVLHLFFEGWGERRVDFRAMDLIRDFGGVDLERLYRELLRREGTPVQVTLEDFAVKVVRGSHIRGVEP